MMLPRKDAETVENAIERRLEQTMVSGGVRPFHDSVPVRKASSAGIGLFLVKPAVAGREREMASRAEKVRTRLPGTAGQPAENRERRGRVLTMRLPEGQAAQGSFHEWIVVPLLGFGHALLRWVQGD